MLTWLPRHPDLSAALTEARNCDDPVDRLRSAVALAAYERDAIATSRIDRLLGSNIAPTVAGSAQLTSLRIALLGSHSVSHLIPAIRVAGLHRGLAIDVTLPLYGQFRQVLMDGDAALEDVQIVLLALDLAAVLPELPLRAGGEDAAATVERAVWELRELWDLARRRFGARVLQQTFLSQMPPVAGANEWLLPASQTTLCRCLNEAVREAAAQDGVLLLDLDAVAACAGPAARITNPVRWYQAKQLIDPVFAPAYGEVVGRIAAAVVGRARKCLVLDLDNTLWGGVVGDDGLENIRLGQGHPEGEAYAAFQHYVAELGRRGVVLAVCSKNDHAVAWTAFERHPDMRLAIDDIACFRADWTDKATSLRTIAKTLCLGLDGLVFVDDNPAEREIVRRELPQVAVPELPDDIAFYPEHLAAAGYFEAVTLTAEDFTRSDEYRANQRRAEVEASTADMDGFLRDLRMHILAGNITAIERKRAVQLINKTNQFNLTALRRSEEELSDLLAMDGVVALAFRLCDRFGDSGLISVIIARPDPAWPDGELLIDTWLMSCRVLGRGVEAAALEILCSVARHGGAVALVGEYRPSGRNGMVERHYERLGFVPVGPTNAGPEGSAFWRLEITRPRSLSHHIEWELAA